jgi:hypothetical protein
MAIMGQTLEYAQPPAWHRRRRWRRVLALALCLAVAGGCWWRWNWLWTAAKLHYFERACMTFSTPQGHVALEHDRVEAKRLIDQGGGYMVRAAFTSEARPAIFVPNELTRYLGKAGGGNDAVLFLHQRTSPGGTRRLVIVRVEGVPWRVFEETSDRGGGGGGGDLPCAALFVTAASMPPLGWRDIRPPVEQPSKSGLAVILSRNLQETPSGLVATFDEGTRFFSGRPDPRDRSRFTIDYMMSGQRDVIDGQLSDDGQVTLKPRAARKVPENLWDILPTDPHASTSRPPSTAPASTRSASTAPAAGA